MTWAVSNYARRRESGSSAGTPDQEAVQEGPYTPMPSDRFPNDLSRFSKPFANRSFHHGIKEPGIGHFWGRMFLFYAACGHERDWTEFFQPHQRFFLFPLNLPIFNIFLPLHSQSSIKKNVLPSWFCSLLSSAGFLEDLDTSFTSSSSSTSVSSDSGSLGLFLL